MAHAELHVLVLFPMSPFPESKPRWFQTNWIICLVAVWSFWFYFLWWGDVIRYFPEALCDGWCFLCDHVGFENSDWSQNGWQAANWAKPYRAAMTSFCPTLCSISCSARWPRGRDGAAEENWLPLLETLGLARWWKWYAVCLWASHSVSARWGGHLEP